MDEKNNQFSRRNFLKKAGIVSGSVVLGGGLFSTLGYNLATEKGSQANTANQPPKKAKNAIANIGPHAGVNQKPIPIKVNRSGATTVQIEMTAQITDIEIDKGKFYKAWTFNGTVPGPVIRVKEGDTIQLSLKNLDPAMGHSIDFHSVYAAPNRDFTDVSPNKTGTFSYPVGSPGVYMYHCATEPVLQHIANGMFGVMIVEPKNGWPTDKEIDREFVLVQSEFYKDGNWDEMLNGNPEYVVMNGSAFAFKETPFKAKVGEKIRIYFNNAGPNHVSSLHVIGTQLETVYIDGDPRNVQKGLQTVLVPASGGAIIEFTCQKAGKYPVLTHQFNHATKGAKVIIEVS